jgi:DNA-binding response OmpR family regulator
MVESILNNKKILAVDDEPDVLDSVEKEILAVAPNCYFYKATEYQTAMELLVSYTYDLIILGNIGVGGFDLLDINMNRPVRFPVVMLTDHALNPQALRRSIEMGSRAYLPKEKLGEIVPFVEDVLRYENLPGWARLFRNVRGFFNVRWRENWKKTDKSFWKEFDAQIAFIKR